VPRTRPPYPPEFRVEAVRLVRSGGKLIREVAEDLGVSEQTLRNWVRQGELDDGLRNDGLTSSEREDLRQLRRRVRGAGAGAGDPQEGSGFLRAGGRSAAMKFRLVDQEKAHHPVSQLCRSLLQQEASRLPLKVRLY
jgi:transposase-like protein